MHTDVATGQIHSELEDGAAALEQLIRELQELSGKLRDQSQWLSSHTGCISPTETKLWLWGLSDSKDQSETEMLQLHSSVLWIVELF